MKSCIFFIVCLLCQWSIFPMMPNAATSVTRHAITWTFDGEYTCGSYANGDPWCIGPVTITSITPSSTSVSGRIQHGSMLNPTDGYNGYDNQFGGSFDVTYMPSLNVARPNGQDLSDGNPLIVAAGNSLVSTRTHDTSHIRPQLVDAAVLTVVSSQPPDYSFRPPYAGTNKSHLWQTSQIRWGLLPMLDRIGIADLPSISSLQAQIERVWIDHGGGTAVGREYHPSNNMPDYGGSMAILTSEIALALLLNYSRAEIETLMIRFLQLGIDWFGITQNASCRLNCSSQGHLWMGGGGHGIGRKWPILFTGLMLNDSNILAYGDATQYPIFQEEQQHFYVSQTDVDLPRYTADGRPRDPYTTEMIGTAEWGEQHFLRPDRDGSNWNTYYRDIVSPAICGHVLAALIMGQKFRWNWPSIFGYQDRWNLYRQSSNLAVGPYDSQFVRSMWDTYRSRYKDGKFQNSVLFLLLSE